MLNSPYQLRCKVSLSFLTYFMESVAKFKALGRSTPDLVTVLHESDAVYMNMGYFQ